MLHILHAFSAPVLLEACFLHNFGRVQEASNLQPITDACSIRAENACKWAAYVHHASRESTNACSVHAVFL